MLQQGNRVFNIDPPTSPNAIMRRAETLPRREQWIRQVRHGELDSIPRIREQPVSAYESVQLRTWFPNRRRAIEEVAVT